MAKQETLIGKHPLAPNIFGKWLTPVDYPESESQCHRSLTEITTLNEGELMEWVSNKVIEYHYSDSRLEKLKEMYGSLGFTEYAENYRMIPNNEDVRKGNMTEIILCEYVTNTKNKQLLKTFRFRYSTNVDQSMKGDDVLMVDYDEKVENIQIFLGEAKFRQSPTPQSVRDITSSLSKDTKPLSIPFLVERLIESEKTREVGEKLDQYIVEVVKRQEQLTYTGLLLSNTNTSQKVQDNLDSDNPKLVFISLGITDPTSFMQKVFALVEKKLASPKTI
ncbi:Hachiman antiphage defense system protein HamA [Ulvibacterium marinum]|uniref:Hachiman antiphage defense system protein HamA n=1 Tax=Ulvibacterium marinum TaxID=2419782 RepID=UPI0024946351|nr:Hachiman antiphage defense system protein HamA [Ulvibacterium marinum]